MSNHIKAEIVRLMREEFDPCPPNYGGHSWHDCAEEVADSIVALFASPQTDLVSRAEVLRVIRSLGDQDADLAMYGAADNARAREYGEAAATRACCAIALMPPATPSPAPAAVEDARQEARDFLRDLAARLRHVACPQIDGWDIDRLLEIAFRDDAPRVCDVCGGDCSAANPPPSYCPMRDGPAPAAVDVEGLVARLVKPLEWKFFPQGFPPCWCAQTPFGDCVVEEEAGSDGPSYAARGTRMNVVARTEGLPEAKAAAQADYEARILSALSPDPALVALIEERDRLKVERDEAREGYMIVHARAAERDQECFRLEDELKGALELINAQNANAATLREMFGQAKERALTAEFAIAACARFLKEGETPAQRIERLHGEITGMMKTLAAYTDRALAAEAERDRVRVLIDHERSERTKDAAEFHAAEAERDALREALAQVKAAISWALGEGDSDFGDNKPENAKPFWWRTELRERARALTQETNDVGLEPGHPTSEGDE